MSVLAQEAVERGYSIESLENGIIKSRENIKMYEDLIDHERNQIKEYRLMIDALERAEREKAEALANVRIDVLRE
jgi:hypothetical protein